MPTFNHAFTIAFAVPGSFYDDPGLALVREKDKVISALLGRVKQLMDNDVEYIEACDPFDTYEEPTN